jgi:hypothetical protein
MSTPAFFDIRNAIAHELDIDLDGSCRKRNQRKVEDVIGHTDALLKVGETLIESVDKRICGKAPVIADALRHPFPIDR